MCTMHCQYSLKSVLHYRVVKCREFACKLDLQISDYRKKTNCFFMVLRQAKPSDRERTLMMVNFNIIKDLPLNMLNNTLHLRKF